MDSMEGLFLVVPRIDITMDSIDSKGEGNLDNLGNIKITPRTIAAALHASDENKEHLLFLLLDHPTCSSKLFHRTLNILIDRDEERLVYLLLQHPRLDISKVNGSLLIIACLRGWLRVVDYLIHDLGIDPTMDNNAPLRWACSGDHAAIVKRLLQDERVDPRTEKNHALISACSNGNIEVVTLLLQWKGKDGSIVNPNYPEHRAIKQAIQFGHVEVLRLLLDSGRVKTTTKQRKELQVLARSCDDQDKVTPYPLVRPDKVLFSGRTSGKGIENVKYTMNLSS